MKPTEITAVANPAPEKRKSSPKEEDQESSFMALFGGVMDETQMESNKTIQGDPVASETDGVEASGLDTASGIPSFIPSFTVPVVSGESNLSGALAEFETVSPAATEEGSACMGSPLLEIVGIKVPAAVSLSNPAATPSPAEGKVNSAGEGNTLSKMAGLEISSALPAGLAETGSLAAVTMDSAGEGNTLSKMAGLEISSALPAGLAEAGSLAAVTMDSAGEGKTLSKMAGLEISSALPVGLAEAGSLAAVTMDSAGEGNTLSKMAGLEISSALPAGLAEAGSLAASAETGGPAQLSTVVAAQLVAGIEREKGLEPMVQPIDPGGQAVPTQPMPSGIMQPTASALTPNLEAVVRLEELTEKFDQRLLSMVQHNEKVMKITVMPEALGRVTVLCRQDKDSVSLEIHVQNQSVRDLIARQEEDIRRVMMDADVDLGGFDVMLGQHRDDPRGAMSDGNASASDERGIAPALEEDEELEIVQVQRQKGSATWVA